MTADTIFRIYSMTKPIVSTALMLLHEEGRFQLEHRSPIPARVRSRQGARRRWHARRSGRPMQVRDLLTHTSGLTYDFMVDTPVAQIYRDAQHHAMMPPDARSDDRRARDASPRVQPGARWHYSVGIDVAARLIEVISGQPLGDFLRDRLFDPLGMVDTASVCPTTELAPARLRCTDCLTSSGANYSFAQLSRLRSPASTNGSTCRHLSDRHPRRVPARWARAVLDHGDYMRFAQMFANGGASAVNALIGRKTLELMHSNHFPTGLLPYELLGLPVPGMGFGSVRGSMLDVARDGRHRIGRRVRVGRRRQDLLLGRPRRGAGRGVHVAST